MFKKSFVYDIIKLPYQCSFHTAEKCQADQKYPDMSKSVLKVWGEPCNSLYLKQMKENIHV